MWEAVEPFGRLNTRSVTAISSLVGSRATSAVATAPLSTRAGVSSPPVSVARITTDVWADADAACKSVTPEANTHIHRSFRISISFRLIRGTERERHSRKQTSLAARRINEIEPIVASRPYNGRNCFRGAAIGVRAKALDWRRGSHRQSRVDYRRPAHRRGR